MLPPCSNRYNRDNWGRCPVMLTGFILGAGMSEALNFGIVTTCIFGISGAVLFEIFSKYFKR